MWHVVGSQEDCAALSKIDLVDVEDEVLSAGKHTGSYLVGKYFDLIKEF